MLSPLFDREFSEHSYGFRPGRSAHQAVTASRAYVSEGKRWVVDLDLGKFFDKVNHEILMSRVARKVKDQRILKLIRRYLKAGIPVEGRIAMFAPASSLFLPNCHRWLREFRLFAGPLMQKTRRQKTPGRL